MFFPNILISIAVDGRYSKLIQKRRRQEDHIFDGFAKTSEDKQKKAKLIRNNNIRGKQLSGSNENKLLRAMHHRV